MLLELKPELVVRQRQIREKGSGLGTRRQGGKAARKAAKTEFEREFLLAAPQQPEESFHPGDLAESFAHNSLCLRCRERSFLEP